MPGEDPRYPLPAGDGRSRIWGGGSGTHEKRNVWVAVASTLIFFGVLAIVIVRSPGWARVQETFFDRDVLTYSLPKILHHFVTDVFIFLVAEVVVLMLAMLLAVVRSLQGSVFTPLRLLAIGYIDVFRGIPTILVILLLGFGMPALGLQGVPKSERFWAIVALILVYSAYVAEVYRAGIESVHPSQAAAARSLGLSRGKTLRYVVLPQAVRRVLPPLLNDFIGLQKDAALVFVIGVVDGLGQANIIASAKFDYTPFVALAIVYLLITIPQTRIVDAMIQRDRKRRMAGGQT
jgi:polar amino acid transport system permease protein